MSLLDEFVKNFHPRSFVLGTLLGSIPLWLMYFGKKERRGQVEDKKKKTTKSNQTNGYQSS